MTSFNGAPSSPPAELDMDALFDYKNERLIERYMADFAADRASAHRCFHGFKQFMAVCASNDGELVTSDPIDGVWHTFLLFTREYERFCTTFIGEYIHHEPFEKPNPSAYLATRAHAERPFGPLDVALWPVNAKGHCSSGACRGDRPSS